MSFPNGAVHGLPDPQEGCCGELRKGLRGPVYMWGCTSGTQVSVFVSVWHLPDSLILEGRNGR